MALTLVRFAVAATTPLAPDEAYYWVWSRALAPGYLDHPPMVALWIRVGTALVGDSPLGVRLFSPLAAALASVLLVQAGEDLLPGQRAGIVAATLLNATLLVGVGAVTMTPDTPLLLFWTATLFALARLHATGRGAWWLAAGGAAGLALDSKYTAALLAPCVLLWLLAAPGLHLWLRRLHPWLGAAIAALLFAPVVWWNAGHDWASFAKQGGRVDAWDPSRAAQFVVELFGGQIAFATPLVALLLGAGIVLATRQAWRRDPAWTLLAAFTLLPCGVFLQHALGDRVQANWPSVLYPAAAIAAAGLSAPWRRLRGPAVVLGFAVTALVYAQGAFHPLALPRSLDPTLARLGGWAAWSQALAAAARADGDTFVAADGFGDAAELAWLLPRGLPVLGHDRRWAWFALPEATAVTIAGGGLLVRSARRAEPPDPADWASIAALPDVVRAHNGVVAERYRLYRVSGPAATVPTVVLPRPAAARTE